MKKLIAAILNFVIWGLGYIYLGKKLLFGFGFLIITILIHIPVVYHHTVYYFQMPGILILISHLIISMLLAYDVYFNTSIS